VILPVFIRLLAVLAVPAFYRKAYILCFGQLSFFLHFFCIILLALAAAQEASAGAGITSSAFLRSIAE
jgi:hypothetical protein